jgi:hypothetical protein
MPLTKEQRVELLAKARLAKANKRIAIKEEHDEDEEEPIVNVKVELPTPEPEPPKVKKTRKKNEIAPLPTPVQVIQEPEDEPEEPIIVPKKKAIPIKWLKTPKVEPEKVCCNERVSKEEYLIDDEPQVVAEKIVIPSKSTLKKPKAPRASSKTLDLTEPTPIEDVLEDVRNNNNKYLPKIVKQAPTPSAPISIRYQEPPLRLFSY